MLRGARQAQGYTQRALAAILGVSQHTISRWEAGVHAPPLSKLPALGEVLRLPRPALLEALSVAVSMPPVVDRTQRLTEQTARELNENLGHVIVLLKMLIVRLEALSPQTERIKMAHPLPDS